MKVQILTIVYPNRKESVDRVFSSRVKADKFIECQMNVFNNSGRKAYSHLKMGEYGLFYKFLNADGSLAWSYNLFDVEVE